MNKTEQLGTDPILKLIIKFSIPSIIGMFVNAIYNIVDRIFIGRYVNEYALAGVTVTFPFIMILFSIGLLFSIGGASLISIKFGEQKHEEAQNIYGNIITMILVSSVIVTILGLIFLEPVLLIMGATEYTLPYASTYMRIILFGGTLQLSLFALSSLARVEGRPKLSMFGQLIPACANIVFDYIFIVVMGLGITGAGIATVISQLIGFVILFHYFFISKSSILKFNMKFLKPKLHLIAQMSSIGMPNFIMTLGNSITTSFLLRYLVIYGGNAAVTSMGVINSLFTLALMPILGLQQGIGPIMGYNHGMKQTNRVFKTLYIGMGMGCIFSTLLSLLIFILPSFFASLFIESTSDTMLIVIHAMLIYFIMLAFLPINILGTAYFQSTAQSKTAFILSICRQGLFLIPAILILPTYFGLDGIWMATPVSDFISIFLTIIYLLLERRKIKAHNTMALQEQ